MSSLISKRMQWKVHTPKLLEEVVKNCPPGGMYPAVWRILGSILHEVGERASELNDPKLNSLMCRLTIYEISDPSSKDYDPDLEKQIRAVAEGTGVMVQFDEHQDFTRVGNLNDAMFVYKPVPGDWCMLSEKDAGELNWKMAQVCLCWRRHDDSLALFRLDDFKMLDVALSRNFHKLTLEVEPVFSFVVTP